MSDKGAKDKVVLIFGAGASAALAPGEIPVMNTLFEVAARFAQADGQIAQTLEVLREAGLLGDSRVPQGNLEVVLERTLSLPRDAEDPWQRPYDGLLLTLHRMFHTLDRQHDVSLYADCLLPLVMVAPERMVFVSFNYDLFLERALAELFAWQPTTGYGVGVVVGYIDLEQAEEAQDESQICDEVYAWPLEDVGLEEANHPIVLKPHGSLNWFVHGDGHGSFWISKRAQGLLLMRPESGELRVPRFWDYPTTNSVDGELAGEGFKIGAVLPAIIPPGKKFPRKIPVFQRIQAQMEEALVQAAILVFIGWSMTESDRQYKDLFRRVTSQRDRSLVAIAVCNYHQDAVFYNRFCSLLPADQFLCCDEGFLSQEAQGLVEKIAAIAADDRVWQAR